MKRHLLWFLFLSFFWMELSILSSELLGCVFPLKLFTLLTLWS